MEEMSEFLSSLGKDSLMKNVRSSPAISDVPRYIRQDDVDPEWIVFRLSREFVVMLF